MAEDKKKILIFGKNGQVATNLINEFANEKNFEVASYSSKEVNFSNLAALEKFLKNLNQKPDFIINAAAYNNVDKAEEEEKEICDLVNHQAVEIIAKYCKNNNINFVHYSTDYVFDGSGDKPFADDNITNLNPVNWYGKTKLLGEQAIINSLCNYVILRVSWVYDLDEKHKNFVNVIKSLAKKEETLKIVDDQIGSPTDAKFIALNTIEIIKKYNQQLPNKIFHLNNGQFISRYEQALQIIDELKKDKEVLKVTKIIPIKTIEYKTKAKRPLNSRLNPSNLF